MISRREVVTAGMLGTLAGGAAAEAGQSDQEAAVLQKGLSEIISQLSRMNGTLDFGQRGPTLSTGSIGELRERFTTHMKAAGKFPDFLEIGVDVFYDVYDWHVRHNQQIQITRIAEQRFAIQFMFTQLIVRWEQDRRYIGVPFDRG
jgi:hypothetical protein